MYPFRVSLIPVTGYKDVIVLNLSFASYLEVVEFANQYLKYPLSAYIVFDPIYEDEN